MPRCKMARRVRMNQKVRIGPTPELGQRGQGLSLGRAVPVQEVHEPLDESRDEGWDAGPHDVPDGPAPLTRVNRL
jgi:hypothetical protein